MKPSKKLIKSIEVSFVSGLLIGLVVGIYQFGLHYVLELNSLAFSSREWWVILINCLSILFLGCLNFYILKIAPSLDSSGIISINLSLRNNEEIPNKKEIPLMIVNSWASTYASFPLGSEGPSITLAGKCASLVNKIFKEKDDENIKLAFGAGFGAAFISPLCGFFYAFEEELHKVNFELIIRNIFMILGMSLFLFLNNHHSLAVSDFAYMEIEDSLVLFLVLFLTITIGFLYLFFIKEVKRFYNRFSNNIFVKYRGFILYGLMLVLGYLLTPYMGGGDKIISLSLSCTSIYVVLLLIVFRMVLTSLAGNGKVTGGLIVPSLAIGALIGAFSSIIFETCGLTDVIYRPYIILLSMCMFFAFISEAPLTAITLFLSNIFYSTRMIDFTSKGLYLGILLILIVNLITRLFHSKALYDMLLDVEIKNKLKTEKVKIF